MAVTTKSFACYLLAILLLFALISGDAYAQQDSVNHKRLKTIVVSSAAILPATYFGLYQLWYKNSPRQPFQFFNDNQEWKQLDKAGHFISSFYFSYGSSQILRWANYNPTKADVAGAIAA